MVTATDKQLTPVLSDLAIQRARRFIRGGSYRLRGPWRQPLHDLAIGIEPPALAAAAGDGDGDDDLVGLWVDSIESDAALAALPADMPAAIAAILATSDCVECLIAVYTHNIGDALRVAADAAAIAAGHRRHVRLFDLADYAGMQTESGWLWLAYERIDEEAYRRFPAAALAIERNLHMDMTREPGRRSDAHLVRYRFASERIAGDARILDCACGLGYGSALLAREGAGRTVTGIDLSPWAVEYAERAFGDPRRDNLRYRHGDAVDLSAFPDRGFDAIVSFETLEHLIDPLPFMRHVHRLLADDGLFVGSVPYRWIFDGDTGDYHHDWFDAEKTLSLCGRFLRVEALWIQTAGGFGAPERVRGLRRQQPLGEEPAGDVEWVLVVARKRPTLRASGPAWLLLAEGVSQLATMAAALPGWRTDGAPVHVVSTAACWDDAYERAMAGAAEAFGFRYGGNLPIPQALAAFAEVAGYEPDALDAAAAATEAARRAAALVTDYPVLDALTGLDVVFPAHRGAPADYALLAALQPRSVRLIHGGLQTEASYRDLPAAAGFPDNPLARLPTAAEVAAPSWLLADAAAVGAARALDPLDMAAAWERLAGWPIASAFLADVRRHGPFAAVVISDPLSRDGLTSSDVDALFVVHQVRALLARGAGRVLIKTHPRDAAGKVEALVRAFEGSADRVRVMANDEQHIPIEAIGPLVGAASVEVTGASSSALLACGSWDGWSVSCVDADYLEPEVRRRAARFARAAGHSLRTLRADDGLIEQAERQRLRRTFLPAPAVRREREMADRVAEAEDMRRAARGRVEYLLRKVEDATRFSVLGQQLLAPQAERRIWIWGTGVAGRRLLASLRALGVQPEGFLDSRAPQDDGGVEGVPVYAAADPAARAARKADALVLIASMHAPEILQRVQADGDWRSTVLAWG